MPKLNNTKSIGYKDINLIAQPQFGVQSREQISKNLPLDKIFVAPMSAVIGEKFAIEALRNGLSICLHRFGSIEDQLNILSKIYDEFGADDVRGGWKNVYVSVGLNDKNRVDEIKKRFQHNQLLIDVANGYLGDVVAYHNFLRKEGYNVMAGNVHTSKGLNLYGAYSKIRVGIGGGMACQTSSVTGYTRGQVTEILECYNDRYSPNQKILADGGIKDGACAAKAFGLGADYIMMGGYFAMAEEAENVIKGEYKYWGGASYKQQREQYGEVRRHSEGKELELSKEGIKPLSEIIKELKGGLSSAISYSGFQNLEQFIGNATYELKHNG